MKAHVGVDSEKKIIHSVVATAANVADCTLLAESLHGEGMKVWAIRPIGVDRSDSGSCARGTGYDPQPVQLERLQRRNGTRQEPHQVASTFESGARGCRDDGAVRVSEGAPPWTEEEHQPTIRHLHAGARQECLRLAAEKTLSASA